MSTATAVQTERPSGGYLWVAAGIIALGSTSSILSSTVVNVAVPQLQRVFGASLTDVQWLLSGYLLGLSAVIPISGWVSDRFGTRRVYITTLVTFTLASLLCGFAWNLQSEIAFRVIQGMAGGMVMPVGMTILMQLAAPSERGRMMSFLGIPMMLAPAMGPTVGGLLIKAFDWHWVFWVNVPAGVLAIIFAIAYLRGSERHQAGRLDVVGVFLSTPGVVAVIYGLTQASSHGWRSAEALIPLGAGLILVLVFMLWELRQPFPLLELSVFKDSGFSAAMGVSIVLASTLFGAVFLVPVFLQAVQGYDTVGAGLILASQGIAAAAAMPVSGWLTDRYGARPVVAVGVVAMVVATGWMAGVSPSTGSEQWAAMLAVRGVAMGFAMMPAFSAAYVTLAPHLISRATALSNTLQRVASSLGIALIATIAQSRIADHVQAIHFAARPAPEMMVAAGRQAVAAGFDDALLIAAGMTLLGLPAAMMLRRPLSSEARAEWGDAAVVKHPPLAGAVRAAAVVLLVCALAGFAYSVGRGFDLLPSGWAL